MSETGTQSPDKSSIEESGDDGDTELTPTKPPVTEQDESVVATAKPGDLQKSSSKLRQPLNITWSFGYNSSLPVRNLSDNNRKMIFYASAHTGVLYDCTANEQFLLQGHSNPITCTCSSADKRWLVTADVGKDCLVSIWDSYSGVPVRNIFDGLSSGTISTAMSSDARFIILVGDATPQVVSVWDWTTESDDPICKVKLDPMYGQQKFVDFSQEDPHQFVSNGDEYVMFYHWTSGYLTYHAVSVTDQTFNKPVGVLVQSCFIPQSTRALTVTTEGSGVVWEVVKQNGVFSKNVYEKMPLKLSKLHSSPVTTVSLTDGMIVTGDIAGCVKFFDKELKLLNWYDNLKFGPVMSIAFANVDMSKLHLVDDDTLEYPDESTLNADSFVVPDFIVSTSTSVIAHVTTNGTVVDVIAKEHDAAVMALATHPSLPRLLTGGYSCCLKLWDYDQKVVLSNREFNQKEFIQCLSYDPKGDYIGVGFTNGTVRVLDGVSLEDCCPPFHYSRDCVTHITFSHDSTYIATADLDRCVTVFMAASGDDEEEDSWQYLAHYRSHYKQITEVLFGKHIDTGAPRLLSLGTDRMLVEYDLANSSVDDLKLTASDRIEQSAIPTAMIWYPPITKESFLLITNSQYKIKLLNASTKMCRKTLLGPTYNSPLQKLVVLPSPIMTDEFGQQVKRYLAFINNDKIGLLILPHDGNPHNSTCLISHPGMTIDLASSYDGKYLFTAGGEDCTVNMWSVDTEALEASKLLGGEELVPFYPMLEGGRDGEFFAEMKDYFYYAQIKHQGPEVTASRDVSTKMQITQIPNVMRALGFYPSEQEIEDMINEVKFSEYVETGKTVTEININDFIKLYINHRPVFGLSPAQLVKAFHVLGESGSIDRAKLLTLLQENGEHLTETELLDNLMTLLNYNEDPEVDHLFTADPSVVLAEEIPQRVSAKQFAEELLGLST